MLAHDVQAARRRLLPRLQLAKMRSRASTRLLSHPALPLLSGGKILSTGEAVYSNSKASRSAAQADLPASHRSHERPGKDNGSEQS